VGEDQKGGVFKRIPLELQVIFIIALLLSTIIVINILLNTKPAENTNTNTHNRPPVAVVLHSPSETTITTDSIILRWTTNRDDDFAEYELHKGAVKGFFPAINTKIVSIPYQSVDDYSVKNLNPATTYFFKIRVYDTSGLYNDSNEIQVSTTIQNQAPNISILNTPNEITETSMNLSWSINTESDFRQYELYRSKTSGIVMSSDNLIQILTVQNVSSLKVDNLMKNTRYYYKLRVVDSEKLFSDSNEVSASTLKHTKSPESVILSRPTIISHSTIDLKWTICDDDDFMEYNLAWSKQPNFNVASANTFKIIKDRNQTTFEVTNLATNTTYYFKVRTIDLDSLYNDSNEVNGTTFSIRVIIDYNGNWSGAILDDSGSKSIDGTGPKSFDMVGGIVVATIQKGDDSSNVLTVQISEGNMSIEIQRSSAAYGIASVSHDFNKY